MTKIEACKHEIPYEPEPANLTEFFKHLQGEVKEVEEALTKYQHSEDGKTLQHLGEELVDVMTMAYTMLETADRIARTQLGIDKFADGCQELVWIKNHLRGYHNSGATTE